MRTGDVKDARAWLDEPGHRPLDSSATPAGGHPAGSRRKDRSVALASSLVGTASEMAVTEVDTGWTMAYAAGLGVVAHPMFGVPIEWPPMLHIIQALREAGFSRVEMLRRVHATDDVIVHRLIRPPERLLTPATLAGIERRGAGAYQLTRFDTFDENGAPVCTTWYGNLYRGIDVAGPDRPPLDAPAALAPSTMKSAPRASFAIPITPVAALVYNAGARLGNAINIHTDAATAKSAGLPGPILHGTATLAM